MGLVHVQDDILASLYDSEIDSDKISEISNSNSEFDNSVNIQTNISIIAKTVIEVKLLMRPKSEFSDIETSIDINSDNESSKNDFESEKEESRDFKSTMS
ncbi:hypothetical protein TSAR_010556 [Trichomalopsis sarcophagae]|uniref:Uncharacterized protein n=1 Tax=Trichomalopsis sarcophagae TaxID=543379 RepID=A0A232EKQ8_9HYME|nr:hypothetical protein TSAR_010556 [Trichomalopsis sarcophagae]